MDIVELFLKYRLDVLLVALFTAIITGIVKLPIKLLAKKTGYGEKITRFITFLPLIIALGLSIGMAYLLNGCVIFKTDFFVRWLSGASGSLAIYAFWEKFVPSENKILSQAEIVANAEIIDKMKEVLIKSETSDSGNEEDCSEIKKDDKTTVNTKKNYNH